ncbi:MAG: hypothetical protein Q8R32_00445 [bacterium]|nr:hypothetical protein [bacterium]
MKPVENKPLLTVIGVIIVAIVLGIVIVTVQETRYANFTSTSGSRPAEPLPPPSASFEVVDVVRFERGRADRRIPFGDLIGLVRGRRQTGMDVCLRWNRHRIPPQQATATFAVSNLQRREGERWVDTGYVVRVLGPVSTELNADGSGVATGTAYIYRQDGSTVSLIDGAVYRMGVGATDHDDHTDRKVLSFVRSSECDPEPTAAP